MTATRPAPAWLSAAGLLVAAVAVLPAAYLFVVVAGDLGEALADALTSRTAAILARTLGLAAAVTATAVAIALPIGWLTAKNRTLDRHELCE